MNPVSREQDTLVNRVENFLLSDEVWIDELNQRTLNELGRPPLDGEGGEDDDPEWYATMSRITRQVLREVIERTEHA